MSLRVSNIFLSVAIVCFAMAVFFLISGKMAHMTCCDQQWVNSAPDVETHATRLKAHTSAAAEVTKIRRESFLYATVSFLAGVGFVFLFYRRRKRHPIRRKVRYEIAAPPEP